MVIGEDFSRNFGEHYENENVMLGVLLVNENLLGVVEMPNVFSVNDFCCDFSVNENENVIRTKE